MIYQKSRHGDFNATYHGSFNTPYTLKRTGFSGGLTHMNKNFARRVDARIKYQKAQHEHNLKPSAHYGRWLVTACIVIVFCFFMQIIGDKALHPKEEIQSYKSSVVMDVSHLASSRLWSETTNASKFWLLANSGQYPEELDWFANQCFRALDYCYHYPSKKDLTPEIDLSEEASGDKVPLLIQRDERWGYQSYGDELIGYAGCGPTCMSMVALYLTGDPTFTPKYMADLSVENGYYYSHQGTAYSFIGEGCADVGLHASECALDESSMQAALDKDFPIIAVVGPGDFTKHGHFIVLVGYNDKGFVVNDPNSCDNSNREWTFEELKPQINAMWAMSNDSSNENG